MHGTDALSSTFLKAISAYWSQTAGSSKVTYQEIIGPVNEE